MAASVKAATYRGKLIVTSEENPKYIQLADSYVDQIVSENIPFSTYKPAINVGPFINNIKFDDSTQLTLADTISVEQVPDDAEAWFVLEPAYIFAQ